MENNASEVMRLRAVIKNLNESHVQEMNMWVKDLYTARHALQRVADDNTVPFEVRQTCRKTLGEIYG